MKGRSRRSDNQRSGHAMQTLLADLKVLVDDTRELLQQTIGLSGEQWTKLRERAGETLAGVEQRLGPLQRSLAEHGRSAAQASAEHLRAHRWSTLAVVAAIAFAVAAVIAWREETPPDEAPADDYPQP